MAAPPPPEPAVRLLAIETATEGCSVALLDGGRVLERFEVAPRGHAQRVLPWADALLAEAGLARASLDAIATSRGPGAFTGVRLGLSLAQGIALALDRPLVGISTLEVLAAGASLPAGRRALAAIDARMGEVYRQAFVAGEGRPQPLDDAQVQAPEAVTLEGEGWHGLGTGFAAADGVLAQALAPQLDTVDATALPRAGVLARLAVLAMAAGEGQAPEAVTPVYLRNQVALTLAEQAAARAARNA